MGNDRGRSNVVGTLIGLGLLLGVSSLGAAVGIVVGTLLRALGLRGW